MEFRILGPLEVENQGRKLPLGGPAERHLLAVLLCLANEPVPMQRLIDELWQDDPPPSARNIIQQYVSRLRRALNDDSRLTTQTGGYVLRVDANELDWDRFDDLVRRAHGASNRNHAAALLREALGLWRGPALAAAGDGPTVAADRLRLEEARLAAIEERIDSELELGRHCDVVAELEALVTQQPQRERLLGQLMLALYRCDRQPEALQHYGFYRRRLGNETGLEPSPALAALESRILTNDPDLDVTDRPAEVTTNLPQRLSSFVGREKEIADLATGLNEHRLVTLVGTGGIGKTSLGLRAAAELTNTFPDGVWLMDLAPLGDASLVGSTAASVVGINLGPHEDALEAVATHLRNQMALIVLDNCEHVVESAADLAFRVLQVAPDVRILATSREPLGITGEALMRVPSLTLPEDGDVAASEAVRLFVDRARLLDSDFCLNTRNQEHVARVCCQLDGIPLAIELAAARMSTMALGSIADGIDHRYELLTKGARTAPRRHQTLRAMVDWSYDLLTDEERIVFRRLSVFAGSFTAEAAKYVCRFEPLEQGDVGPCLGQLVDASLVDPPEPSGNRFRMMETIRDYAHQRLESSGETPTSMRRLASYLLEEGPPIEDGYPSGDYATWYLWMHGERDNYRAALDWAYAERNKEVVAELTIAFRCYLNYSNLNSEAASHVGRALDLVGNESSRRQLLLSWMAIGDHMVFGGYETAAARARSVYQAAQGAGDTATAGIALGYEAMAAVRSGDMAVALDLFAEACTTLVEGNHPRSLDVLTLYAFHLARTGDFDKSRAILNRIEDLGESARDPRFSEYTANLFGGWTELYAGNIAEAEQMLRAEEDYAAQFGAGEHFMYYIVWFLVGVAQGNQARARHAVAELDRSVTEKGSPGLRRDVATMKGIYEVEFGEPATALEHLADSLTEARGWESVADMVEVVYILGDCALALGDCASASILYAAALAGYQRCGLVTTRWQQDRLAANTEEMREALGSGFDEHWERGSEMSFDEMVAFATEYVSPEL